MRRQTFLLWFTVLFGCGSGEPYDLVPVSGQVTYEDDGLIPAERIIVRFRPLAAPRDAKSYPLPGFAEVDPKTGKFAMATTHRHADGLVAGRHRVIVLALDGSNMPTVAIPRRYWSAEKTPLEVDAADGPFHLKVARPAKRVF